MNVPLEKFDLPKGKYFAREFWNGVSTRISGKFLTINHIPAHGVKLLALRSAKTEQACYLGSDLHISQGLEVTQWSAVLPNISFRLERPDKAQGHIDLYLPRPPTKITNDQAEIDWQEQEKDIYRLQVQFQQAAEVEISLNDPR